MVLVVFLFDDLVKTVTKEEGLHVVEIRFTTINEFCVVAIGLQKIRNREEVGLTLTQLYNRTRWHGGKPVVTASIPRTERVPVAYS